MLAYSARFFFLTLLSKAFEKVWGVIKPIFCFCFLFSPLSTRIFFVSPLSTMNLWFHERRVDERSIVKICSGSSLNFRRLTVESFSSQFISEVKQNNENVKVKKT